MRGHAKKALDMVQNASFPGNCCAKKGDFLDPEAPRAAWLVTVLSSVLIFTTVVDILGSLLVIISVLKNRKLRNSGKDLGTCLWFCIHNCNSNSYPGIHCVCCHPSLVHGGKSLSQHSLERLIEISAGWGCHQLPLPPLDVCEVLTAG
ncbi:melatonin receptor type 1B [Pelobates cultripes]|uniref:Melatonin receptor type 1B n=1 Tax=Pelobates cultripes TaxID=61616 RepID=A0AAD1VRI1_PELCU|nr:melatonin receptor type 1B [Pelobates cultripes]